MKNCDKHSHKCSVVVHSNVITYPDAVMIKLITASVAPLTMFCILKYMCIAEVAVKPIFIFVELYLSLLFCFSEESFKSYCWICRVASCDDDRCQNHSQKKYDVDSTEHEACWFERFISFFIRK